MTRYRHAAWQGANAWTRARDQSGGPTIVERMVINHRADEPRRAARKAKRARRASQCDTATAIAKGLFVILCLSVIVIALINS